MEAQPAAGELQFQLPGQPWDQQREQQHQSQLENQIQRELHKQLQEELEGHNYGANQSQACREANYGDREPNYGDREPNFGYPNQSHCRPDQNHQAQQPEAHKQPLRPKQPPNGPHPGQPQHPNHRQAGQPQLVSVACQTEPNLIDKLVSDCCHSANRKPPADIDLYHDYVRSAQSCGQFWPLDNNPIRALVPAMLSVELPEQYLRNESLMFDLAQAISSHSKLVHLLAKYIHHIVPNVIISKRIDLIPLITCAIRVCREPAEQERLMSLLFNLIKRPNEEQRRMILAGLVVVLQVSPGHGSGLQLLPSLWEHVSDRFPERRVLLAEACAALAHYVRPAMRTSLILAILVQLLRDRSPLVRAAACKSYSCLLALIMDRNDEVFDACLSTTEDIIQDVLRQTPVSFCEHRLELEQVRFCALETAFPLLCMWAVKLGRFKLELADFYLAKAERFVAQLSGPNPGPPGGSPRPDQAAASGSTSAAAARRRSAFQESGRAASSVASALGAGQLLARATAARRQSSAGALPVNAAANSAHLTQQRALAAYLKMLAYLVPFVFSDAVHSCAWLSKSNLLHEQLQEPPAGAGHSNRPGQHQSPAPDANNNQQQPFKLQLYDRPLVFANKLLEPTLVIDQAAIVAFHDQLQRDHMLESLDWLLAKFLPRYYNLLAALAAQPVHAALGTVEGAQAAGPSQASHESLQELLASAVASTRHLCLLFGKHLARTRIRPLIRACLAGAPDQAPALAGHAPAATSTASSGPSAAAAAAANTTSAGSLAPPTQPMQPSASLMAAYLASLTSFEPVEQQEFEEIVLAVRQFLQAPAHAGAPSRHQVEMLALAIRHMATSPDHIQSPSTRQKFLVYILDALLSYSNQTSLRARPPAAAQQQQQQPKQPARPNQPHPASHGHTQSREFILIIFRHILTCLVEPSQRPADWAHILVTKFLPLLISLANDASDVYVCTYARLMCAQLVETFDTHLNGPQMTRQSVDSMLPALASLRALTEQIKASNLRRQIECLTRDLNEKFFKDPNNNNNNNTLNNNNNPTQPTTAKHSKQPVSGVAAAAEAAVFNS